MKAAGGASWRAQGTAELAGRGTPGTGTGGGARRGAPGQGLATGGRGRKLGGPGTEEGVGRAAGSPGLAEGRRRAAHWGAPGARRLLSAPGGGGGGGGRGAGGRPHPDPRAEDARGRGSARWEGWRLTSGRAFQGPRHSDACCPSAPRPSHRGLRPRRGPRLVAACGSNGCQEMWDPTHDPARGARSPSCRKSSGRRAGWERTCCGGDGSRVVELPEPAEELEVPRRPSQKCPGAPGIFLSQH